MSYRRSASDDLWLYLQPRETGLLVDTPVNGEGENADLLRTIQGKVNRVRNELTLTGSEVVRVKAAARNWRLGYERQFKALVEAIGRHDGWA